MAGPIPGTPDDWNVESIEDSFITVHGKEGRCSQKIPLVQFLEKVMGGKVDNDIKLKALSFLVPSNMCSSADSDSKVVTDSKTNCHVTSIGESISESENVSIKLKAETGITESEKPKGRGRPRKVRIEAQPEDELSIETCVSFLQQNKNKDTSSSSKLKDQTTPTPSLTLRRSSRVPTKNSKFKDDFVDSSIISSKGSSSGDTRLMTLALAAECHTTTKPNKQTTNTHTVKSHVGTTNSRARSETENSSTPIQQSDAVVVDKSTSDFLVQMEYSDELNQCDTKESTATTTAPKHTLVNRVLKRTLQSQLYLRVAETISELHVKPISHDTDNKTCKRLTAPHYYVIAEPKTQKKGSSLLIQKCDEGLQINVVDTSGNDPKEQFNPNSNTSPPLNYFQCKSCDKIFASKSQWQHHFEQTNCVQSTVLSKLSLTADKEIHTCSDCYQSFPFKFMLDNHMQKKDKCNAISCQVCHQDFSSQFEVEEHRASCHGVIYSHEMDACHKSVEVKKKTPVVGLVKTENILSSQEEEIYRQRGDGEMFESAELQSVDMAGVKVDCELCGMKFSTYSGLWHHKLETHREFFPPGLKEKLEIRLDKTQHMLSSVSSSNAATAMENRTKSHYFVVMKPKWYCSKLQLKASMENKKLTFSSMAPNNDVSISDSHLPKQLLPPLTQKRVLFYCNQCSTQYQTASDYREHRSKIHNECFETPRYLGAFQCSYCSDTFPCQYMLQEHLKRHTGRRLLPCTLCGLTFYKIQERRQHWKQAHPGVGCPNCGKMYASIKYLQKHISLNCQDHYPATKKFIAFRKKQHSDFFMEEKDKRVEKRLIKCHFCSKICSSVHGWRRHMSENHEDEGFSKLSNTCIICNEVIYGYKALEKHLLEKHAEDSGLPIEEENTIIKQAVENSKIRIQDYKKAGKSYTDIFQDEEGMFHCPECPKTHSDIKAINIHIKTHVNMQLECSICKKSFKNPTLLKQHVMRHRTTAVYNCETCGKKFLTLQKLNKHIKVHHTKESFVCELCGMSFALNDYLLKHKRSHTDNRPHSCSVCGKTFRTKPELRVHILIHTRETPYVCEHCGRGFTQKGNWRIHLAQHTGVKPHKCHLCELSFALPSHLKRHLLTHNQKINYRCMWCDKECTQRKHMQMHVSRVHKEDFFQYEEQMKLDNPVPIAPSQMKIYNRRLGKAGQVRKPYKTRAKKCKSSFQDILDGAPIQATEEEICDAVVDIKPMIVETSEETVTSDINIHNHHDITTDNMQILVSEDHQNYVKHDIPAGLIEEDGSNVEIVMGDNNEINIIINNNAENSINADHLALQDGLVGDESGAPVSLTHFTDAHGQLPSCLQQAVNALVTGQKGEEGDDGDVVGDDAGLPLDMEAMITQDNYTIVYPSGS